VSLLRFRALAFTYMVHRVHFILDGNNIGQTYTKVKKLAESIKLRPMLIESLKPLERYVYGHEEASGTK
jgi:2-oxoisovalerate dehydrogenase E1 component